MGATVRTPKLITIGAGVVTAQTMEFGPTYDPNSERLVIVNMNASDSIALSVVGVYPDPNNPNAAPTEVPAVVQTFTGATSFAYTMNGPVQKVSVTKTGTNGAASVFFNG